MDTRSAPASAPVDLRDPAVFAAAFDLAPTGIGLVEEGGRIVRANTALGDLLGAPPEQLVGRTVHGFGHPDDAAVRLPDRAGLLAGTVARSVFVKRYRRTDGTVVWLRISTSVIGRPHGPLFLSHFDDVSAEQDAVARADHAAAHDPLTGLGNRVRLAALLEQALAATADPAVPDVAVLFCDLDDFKLVNDGLGHEAGDEVLRVVGRRLAATVRSGEVTRFGGDEFVAVVRNLPLTEVPALCRRMLDALAAPVEVAGGRHVVGVSIGVAVGRVAAGADRLLRDADAAMYAAKVSGRNRFMLSDEVVRAAGGGSGEFRTGGGSTDVADLVAADELVVHAQPLRDLATLRITGVEVLARWRDRSGPPLALIDAAARARTSRALGRWALQEACRRRAAWVRATGNPDLGIAVNLDGDHVGDAQFVDDVRAALRAWDVPATALTVEITERAMVSAFPAVVDGLAELIHDGCRISLDDFGTGWSSLSYLRLLPASELKLDRVFVQAAGRRHRDAVLLRGIARLARDLGLAVVAEGIETPAELAAARAAGCTTGQGFLLGRPSADGADWHAQPSLPT